MSTVWEPRLALRRPRARRVLAALIALAAASTAARGQTPDAIGAWAGRPVTGVRLVQQGTEITDPGVRDLVETRAGQPLSLAAVRESLAHLFSLGRFQDIQVEADADGAGVSLRYRLVPLRSVTSVEFRGTLGLPKDRLRTALADRFSGLPPIGRAQTAAGLLRELYTSVGHLRASVTPSVESRGGSDTVLVFDIDAGPRAILGEISVAGDPRLPPAALLDRLDLRSGGTYDRERLNRRLADYVADLRSRGFYEASASHAFRASADGARLDLDVDVRAGPHVTVTFDGDPLPDDRRAELVPVEREGTVDLDLLDEHLIPKVQEAH